MDITIYPLDKVLIDGAAVCLGMERSAVETVIGGGQLIGRRYYYFNSEMTIDYNNGRGKFIEFLYGSDGILKLTIYGMSVFEANANDLFEVLKQQNDGPLGDTENRYAYQFQCIGVGIYREGCPTRCRGNDRRSRKFRHSNGC